MPVALDGCPISIGAARITFKVSGLGRLDRARDAFAELSAVLSAEDGRAEAVQGWSATKLQLRDALIALDGSRAGGSYRDISEVIYGARRTKEAWRSASTALKDRVRRALKRGLWLSSGGYRQLL